MSSGLSATNPRIVNAFRSLLLHEALFAALILVILALAWNLLRAAQLRRACLGDAQGGISTVREAPARRLLRIGFWLLWIQTVWFRSSHRCRSG